MTEKELRAIFCKNIKTFRIRNNWSQVALSQKAGVSVNFINDIEAGKKWASPATMIKIAAALDVHVYELLKPSGLPPDNLRRNKKKYADNVNEALEGIRAAFLKERSEEHTSELQSQP
jgi:transcriptional regulator with XRE-family HTH domain